MLKTQLYVNEFGYNKLIYMVHALSIFAMYLYVIMFASIWKLDHTFSFSVVFPCKDVELWWHRC